MAPENKLNLIKIKKHLSSKNFKVDTSWNNITNPMGGFYFYIDVKNFTSDSQKLVKKILRETGVALTSGIDFDKKHGNKTIRLSFSSNHSIIKEAIKRLVEWINCNH